PRGRRPGAREASRSSLPAKQRGTIRGCTWTAEPARGRAQAVSCKTSYHGADFRIECRTANSTGQRQNRRGGSMSEISTQSGSGRKVLDMSGYQWTVVLAAWLGWGFDVFDGMLFNYVAPNCVPTLLGLTIGSPEAKAATLRWTGLLTSLLLVGWAIGGIVFGRLTDRIGRTRTLMLTMSLYAVGTAACAAAPNLWVLALCRVVASLGIGGEWAAGAAMVAEVVPEKRRVEAGALLYTSAPLGLF